MDVLSPVSAGFILRSACTTVASAGSKRDYQASALRTLSNDNNTHRQDKEAEPYDPEHGEGWSVRAQDLSITIFGWSTRSRAQ